MPSTTPPSSISSLPFKAKTYKLDGMSTRSEILQALRDDKVFDHWKAGINLDGIPLSTFHPHHQNAKVITNDHEEARTEIAKEHRTAKTLHAEYLSYQQIIRHHMQTKQYDYLNDKRAKIDFIVQLLTVIIDRMEDLHAIAGILLQDNRKCDRLPMAFCETLIQARRWDASLWGGMLRYHAYLKNHNLEDGGFPVMLEDPPPLKPRKKFAETLARLPKKLKRKITGF